MIVLKMDIMEQLRAKGYTAYRLGRHGERIFGEATIQKIRSHGLPSWHELDIVCRLLDCQPGDVVGYQREE